MKKIISLLLLCCGIVSLRASDNKNEILPTSPKGIVFSPSDESLQEKQQVAQYQNDKDDDEDQFFDAQQGTSVQLSNQSKMTPEYKKLIRSKNPKMFQYKNEFFGYDKDADYEYSNFQTIIIKNANPAINPKVKQPVMKSYEVPAAVAKYYGTDKNLTPEQCQYYYVQRAATAKAFCDAYIDQVLHHDEWMVDELKDFYDNNWRAHYKENIYNAGQSHMTVKELEQYLLQFVSVNRDKIASADTPQSKIVSVKRDKLAFVDMPQFQDLKNKVQAKSNVTSESDIVEVD